MKRHHFFNPNPYKRIVGDCAVRAIAAALSLDWNKAFLLLCCYGLERGDLPSANNVWGALIEDRGFTRKICEETTVSKFSEDHPAGKYVLAVSGHVVTVIDGEYYDSWDSGDCIVLYYFEEG